MARISDLEQRLRAEAAAFEERLQRELARARAETIAQFQGTAEDRLLVLQQTVAKKGNEIERLFNTAVSTKLISHI